MKTDATTYRQRQILLIGIGLAVFSEPFLGILRTDAMIFGLPATMVSLFGLWLGLIVGIAWMMERGRADVPAPIDVPDVRDAPRTAPGDGFAPSD